MATPAAPLTGNPILDDPDSGQQTFAHPTANPIISDPDVGQSGGGAPSMLGTSWPSLGDILKSGWANIPSPTFNAPLTASPLSPQPAFKEPIESHIGTGFMRGVRDFWDKTIEVPHPDYGYTPTDDDIAQIKQQNADDRAQFDKQYAGNPSAEGGRLVGNIVGTLPVLGPLGEGVSAGLRTIPALAPGIRGAGGIVSRAGERAISGAVGGGTQAAATSDPSQPLAPQIGTGAGWGAGLGVGLGAVSDIVSNAVKRLTGGAVRTSPYPPAPYGSREAAPGTPLRVPDQDIEHARQAQQLDDEGVPLLASQVSNDPILQGANKYGSQMPFSGSGDFLQNQQQRLRNAYLQRAQPGTPASLVTPNFVDLNDQRIGTMYDNSVRAVPSVPSVDPATGLTIDRSFAGIRSQIPSSLPSDAQAQIHGAMNDISDAFRTGGGTVTGDGAQQMTRRTQSMVSPLLDSDNPDVRRFGMQIRDEVNQRLHSQMTPDQQATFADANSQFRALRTLQNVADSDGSFTPGQLYDETKATADQFKSGGALDDIARAGKTVIQPTLDGRGTLGKVTGAGAPLTAGLIGGGVAKALTDLVTTGGAGVAGTAVGGLLNRAIQAGNRGGGPRAIASTLAPGGGASVADIQNALSLLRMPVVASRTPQQ